MKRITEQTLKQTDYGYSLPREVIDAVYEKYDGTPQIYEKMIEIFNQIRELSIELNKPIVVIEQK